MKSNKLTFNNKISKPPEWSRSYFHSPDTFRKFLKVTIEKLSLSGPARAGLYALLDFLTELVQKRGADEGIRYIKKCRMYLYQWRSFGPRITDNSRISRDRDGLPKLLGALRSMLRSRDDKIFRAVLTVLQLSYILKSSKKPDISTVTKPLTVSELPNKEFSQFLDELELPKMFDSIPEWSEPHFTSKSGPNGQAMASCGTDLASIPEPLLKDLCILGGESFTTWVSFWRQFPLQLQKVSRLMDHTYEDPSSSRYRKLTFVNSPEGKKRVIAIFDYWSQTVLKPIHDWSMLQLRRFEADCTFNQNHGKIDFEWTYAESIDLSAATDRFPVGFQSIMLEKIMGPAKTLAWENILTKYEFPISWLDNEAYAKYSVGQPMGAYSSWAVFSLCHHLIVQWSAKKASAKMPYKRYRLLGDDIVIFDKDVASHYRKIIQSLGVEVSVEKTLQSKNCYEFAKRFYTRTSELTPFPIASLFDGSKSMLSIWASLLVAGERGFDFCQSVSRPSSVADYAHAAGLLVRRFKVYRYASIAESILSLSSPKTEETTRSWHVKSIARHLGLRLSCNMKESSRSLLVGKLLLHFMNERLSHQIQGSKNHNVRMARLATFGLIIHPESGKVEEPIRVDLSFAPQFYVLQQSLKGVESLAYEIKELISQSSGSSGERHYWRDTESRTFSLLAGFSPEGSPEQINQSVLLILRRSVSHSALDMSSLISRQANQPRIDNLSAFIRFCIEGVESSNRARREALS